MNHLAGISPAFNCFAAAITGWSAASEHRVTPDRKVFTERAALLALPEASHISANGSCRLLRSRDGWVAINMARPEDWAMVPALLGDLFDGGAFEQLETTVEDLRVGNILSQARLLGIAVSGLGEESDPPTHDSCGTQESPPLELAQKWSRRPLVVDLSALWAGPLCGAFLAEAGCDVIKIESSMRPDSTLASSEAFHERLNGRKALRTLDFASPCDRAALDNLLDEADVVITSARRRALDSLGLSPDTRCRRAKPLIWIAITGHGLYGQGSDRIGFGDDCAVAGALVHRDAAGRPLFVGDAIADPLTGLRAAALALKALALRWQGVFDISLAGTAALANSLRAAARA